MDRSNSESDSQKESHQQLLDLVRWHELAPVELKQLFDKNLSKYDNDGDGKYSSREVSLALLDDNLNKENSKFFLLLKYGFSPISSLAGEDMVTGVTVFLFPKRKRFRYQNLVEGNN